MGERSDARPAASRGRVHSLPVTSDRVIVDVARGGCPVLTGQEEWWLAVDCDDAQPPPPFPTRGTALILADIPRAYISKRGRRYAALFQGRFGLVHRVG